MLLCVSRITIMFQFIGFYISDYNRKVFHSYLSVNMLYITQY